MVMFPRYLKLVPKICYGSKNIERLLTVTVLCRYGTIAGRNWQSRDHVFEVNLSDRS